LPQQRERFSAFTLVELIVSMGVLVLLVPRVRRWLYILI